MSFQILFAAGLGTVGLGLGVAAGAKLGTKIDNALSEEESEASGMVLQKFGMPVVGEKKAASEAAGEFTADLPH